MQQYDVEAARPVVVIGLDGITWDLVQPWIAAGDLPTLAEFTREGTSGTLLSTPIPVSAAAWTTAFSGKNPGKHGIFDFRFPSSGTEGIVNSTMIRTPMLWDILSDMGKRVGVINVPVTYPPHAVNGFMVTGLLTPSSRSTFTYPPELRDEILRMAPDYRFGIRETHAPGNEERVLNDLLQMTEEQLRVAIHLLKTNSLDFLALVFMASDTAHHLFWGHMDSEHPLHDPKAHAPYRDYIKHVYQDLDQAVAKLRQALPQDATLIVVSDHGAGPLHGVFRLNRWLASQGLLSLKQGFTTSVKVAASRYVATSARSAAKLASWMGLGRLAGLFPPRLRGRLVDESLAWFGDIDWGQTKAYAIGSLSGQIFLNREILTLEDQTRVTEDILRGLEELVDPCDGGPFVSRVFRAEDVYHGPYTDQAADINFVMSDCTFAPSSSLDLSDGTLFAPPFHGETGTHRPEGVIIMTGSGVRRGTALREAARLEDLTPTVLYLMGLPALDDMDGRVLIEAIRPDHLSAHPVEIASMLSPGPKHLVDYTPEEQREIEERLRKLGYLD